jgi:hypothetical protein
MGYSALAEIDMILDDARDGSPDTSSGPEDELPAVGNPAFSVTRPGDMWLVGRHRLVCGDARSAEPLRVLLDDEEADLIFSDPPHRRTCLRAWTYPPSPRLLQNLTRASDTSPLAIVSGQVE